MRPSANFIDWSDVINRPVVNGFDVGLNHSKEMLRKLQSIIELYSVTDRTVAEVVKRR
jgi:hypothetical protein